MQGTTPSRNPYIRCRAHQPTVWCIHQLGRLLGALLFLQVVNIDNGIRLIYGRVPTRRPNVSELIVDGLTDVNSSKDRLVTVTATATNDLAKVIGFENLEAVLKEPGVECGRVPIFEELYERSINESLKLIGEDKGEDEEEDPGEVRILHGLEAIRGEWPWIARIELGSEEVSCTGSVINSRWVITAGHCGFNRSSMVDKIVATLGLYDLQTPDETASKIRFDKLIVHPDYNDLNNDLTLLRTREPIVFDKFVQPVCLIESKRDVLAFTRNKVCYAIGYGLMEDMIAALKLQKMRISAREPDECNSDHLNNIQLRPNTVCVGPAKGQIGASCRGDSGGPNVCYDQNSNRWNLFGTVSYGPADCDREQEDNWLTVAVDLSNYRTWILQTILMNS